MKHILFSLLLIFTSLLASAGNVTDSIPDSIASQKSLNTHRLGTVVVTARESRGLTTSSIIGRDAMDHLQPSSFTDILELLPGNISHTPDMGRVNSIALRETGITTASGAPSTSTDYAISSLGTSFIIDGTPIDNDASLQTIPNAATGDASLTRSAVNRGVDMRSIATDNIESVEIMRGIPSAEYGNLTSGVVNIRRRKVASPFSARFKADGFSKLFSAGKGFAIPSHNHIINIDGGFLDSKTDPRNNLENYKRANASARATFRWSSPELSTTWNVAADYTGSFDNSRVDPDLNSRRIDEFASSYHRAALSSVLNLSLSHNYFFSTINLTTSASLTDEHLTRRKEVTPPGVAIAPTSMSEGIHDAKYLIGSYLSEFEEFGRPVSGFAKLRGDGIARHGGFIHNYKAGAEWTYTKNFGRGQVYDLLRPLSGTWTTRPRAFSSIPSLSVFSAFAEDRFSAPVGRWRFDLLAGVRMIMLPLLDSRYHLAARPYFDPRLNLSIALPSGTLADRPLSIHIAGGYGLTSRMPTVDYLFPQVNYSDFVQMAYYNVSKPQELSRVNLRTYITDPTNYDLRPARNQKWEIRADARWGSNSLSIGYFRENLSSGFRYSTLYDVYSYRRYDTSSLDPTALAAPPALESLPYTDRTILDGFSRVTNGTRIDKEGIEFQVTTARWQAIHTSLSVSGAWLRTRYSNSSMLFYPVSEVIGSEAISNKYVGLYDTADGRISHQLNTNFMFDTQIPRWGLIFTTTLQCMWWVSSQRLREQSRPLYYLSAADRQLHPYTDESAADVELRHLVRRYSESMWQPTQVPTALYLNLKATKKIGRYLKLSAFVNRIIDYLPSYQSNGLTVRRASEAYFGMEAVVTI